MTSNATLTVQDSLAPALAMNGASPLYVECHGSYADPGASALDACVGPVTVTTNGTVDTAVTGTNTVTYTANDGNGNTASVFRTVIVRDTTAPTITWSFTNLTLSADTNCSALMPDVTGTNYVLGEDVCSTALSITQSPAENALLPLGTNTVVISVADSSGNTSWSTNTVVVADTTAPAITLQPQSQTNLVGADAVFTVQATSCGSLTYQWFLSTNSLAGQTNATLTVTNVQLADAGDYLVTIASAAGSSTSAVAVLTVDLVPPPSVVSGPNLLPNGHFHVGFSGLAGYSYTVLYSVNVDGPWATLTNLTADANGLFDLDDPTQLVPPTRFYRTTYP